MRRLALIPLIAVVSSSCGSLARVVDIDIDPDSDLNCIEDYGHGAIPVGVLRRGLLPVAILGRAELDVRQVDPGSVELLVPIVGARGRADPSTARYEYVNLDAYEDLVLRIALEYGSFRTRSGTATLTGNLFDGTAIKGTDTVSICIVQNGPGRYP